MDEEEVAAIHQRYALVAGTLDERARRLVAASEALAVGRGGIAAVARATGLARRAMRTGSQVAGRPERGGGAGAAGGRRAQGAVATDATLLADLEALVSPRARGDPEAPLRWTIKSLRTLAAELRGRGHQVSHQSVAGLLRGLGYSLQGNRKAREGGDHPDRDAQFDHIGDAAAAFLLAGDPVISVDAKKKELVGDFKNGGREWRPIGEPEEVRTHDFVDPLLGRATPYGVYDLAANAGWVNVGIDHDTAAFAVESIRRWWAGAGRARYPHARRLLVTADGGGSNGSRTRLWKWELQRLADETGLAISVCHFPPGTSKWNKIEHRLFSFISMNWRGVPLASYAAILSLIAATTTAAGLTVESRLDTNTYPKGIEVTKEQMDRIRIERDDFHGEWNYTILPHAA